MKWRPKYWFESFRQRDIDEGEVRTTSANLVRCPRCRKNIIDRERSRNAHRMSCVRIPRARPTGWGVKTLV